MALCGLGDGVLLTKQSWIESRSFLNFLSRGHHNIQVAYSSLVDDDGQQVSFIMSTRSGDSGPSRLKKVSNWRQGREPIIAPYTCWTEQKKAAAAAAKEAVVVKNGMCLIWFQKRAPYYKIIECVVWVRDPFAYASVMVGLSARSPVNEKKKNKRCWNPKVPSHLRPAHIALAAAYIASRYTLLSFMIGFNRIFPF